jgi:hypothetical protein
VAGFNIALGSGARTYKQWFKSIPKRAGLLDSGLQSTGKRYALYIKFGRVWTEIQGSYWRSNASFNDDNWHCWLSKEDGTPTFPASHSAVVDGADITASASVGASIALDTTADGDLVFRSDRTAILGNEQYDEYSLRLFQTSLSMDLSEYNNQSSPSTFWTTGAAFTPGGGGGGISITLDSGSYAQAGSSTSINSQLNINPNSGGYLQTGTALNLSAQFSIANNTGFYSADGTNTNLSTQLNITTTAGSYVLTGTSSNLKAARKSIVESGSYNLTGTNLNLLAAYGIIATSTTYTLTGVSVRLRYSGDPSQTIETVTSAFAGDKYSSGFGQDLYSSQYKASTITVTFKA